MKKFVALYYTNAGHQPPPQMSEAEQEAMMKPWMEWNEKYGERIVDLGAPCMPAHRSSDGADWRPSDTKVSGYSIVSAEDLSAAQEMFKGHPIYSYPDHTIELSECAAM